ncbi:MAG TPA: MBL fold metallo-hydrolase [Solirubrobacteraceae bacterium]|jgi:L-ascorbate metabolism protein UlaG (beta-lactamase superfamily)|nr:MBL fold metallo-hydrolase [Solirubrobacteraceae bacterium]
MRVEWFGQSAFHLSGKEGSVAIDPFGDMSALSGARGIQWDYPAIAGVEPDLLLVTHEHGDHNGVEAIDGDPATLRSTAGTHDSPIGQVTGVASEHDDTAGTQRGPNTMFVFTLDGVRVCHMGDFGQRELRPEQAAAIGEIDLLFVPVGGGPTLGAVQAAVVVERLKPRWVVPMHYRTERIGFLEPADAFLEAAAGVERVESPTFDTASLPSSDGPLVVVPAAP